MDQKMKEQVAQLFVSALDMDSTDDRKAFLDHACQGDVELRALVEDMIALQPKLDRLFPEGGAEFVLTEDLPKISARLE